MDRRRWMAAGMSLGLVLAAGCSGGGETPQVVEKKVVKRATAYLESKSGSELVGRAIFINEGERVALSVRVENAPPGSLACHLHEVGDCSAEDASSAGGHWNPAGAAHGKWGEGEFHLGDIGNIEVGPDGKGELTLTTGLWTMGSGEANDILGRAVVVHAGTDDFTTQPTGAAGGRIGCGVIQ